MTLAAFCLLGNCAFAQNGNFDDLFLDGGSGGQPFIEMTDGSETFTLKNRFGDLEIINRFNQLCIEIDEFTLPQTIVTNNSGVAIGHSRPQEALHVFAGAGTPFDIARIMVENAQSTTTLRNMMVFRNNGPIRLSLENTRTNDRWLLTTDSNDAFSMKMLGSGKPSLTIRESGQLTMRVNNKNTMVVQPNGNMIIAGTLIQSSDRNLKEDFADLNRQEILSKVVDLPVTSWRFKQESDEVRHIGPMSQDFQKAFGLSKSDKTIAPLDSIGVALVAIQGLNEKVQEKDQKIAELEQELKEQQKDFEARLRMLEAAVSEMTRPQ